MTRRIRTLFPWSMIIAVWTVLFWISSLSGCFQQPVGRAVTVVFDGQRISYTTYATTVRGVLDELKIELGPIDRVEPDLWQELAGVEEIMVTRVEVVEELESRPVAFRQKVIKSEALPAGERKILQLGSSGREEVIYRVVIENGKTVRREEAMRRVVDPPIDEILAVGMQVDLPAVPLSGTVAYISGGNAWMMRSTSASRRPLTSSGDLDGRVFALSPDGDWLLYSRVTPDRQSSSLNSLWIVGTSIIGEEPQPLNIESAVYAEWMADSRGFIFSTAERIEGAPGWRARNDLWRVRLSGLLPAGERTGDERIRADVTRMNVALPESVYSWWGTTFALSSDERWMAFGQPEGVGVLDLQTGKVVPLLQFAVFHTYGEWVWLPELAWSPAGDFLACSAHGIAPGVSRPEDSPVFDLWILERSGAVKALVVKEVGMWTAPSWSPPMAGDTGRLDSQIAYGVARNPRDSQNSRYDLYLMDRDGSNRRRVFPPVGQEGLVAPDVAWSPNGTQMVVAHQGTLYLVTPATGETIPLTADGHSAQPRWAR